MIVEYYRKGKDGIYRIEYKENFPFGSSLRGRRYKDLRPMKIKISEEEIIEVIFSESNYISQIRYIKYIFGEYIPRLRFALAHDSYASIEFIKGKTFDRDTAITFLTEVLSSIRTSSKVKDLKTVKYIETEEHKAANGTVTKSPTGWNTINFSISYKE
jgi:hypothetical protein